MQKTLACLAIACVGSFVGCSKDKVREPTTARGHSTPAAAESKAQPAPSPEEPKMTPASGTREMTPASGTKPAVVGTEPGPELAVGSRGSVILQYDAANELGDAVCQRQASCEKDTAKECDQVVRDQAKAALAGCDHGLSRTEFYVCLTAIAEKACGTDPAQLTECRAASLCLP